MGAASGIVTKIFVKELPQPDTYQNTHRASIKIDDGEWIGLGTMKGPKLTINTKGKEWVELTEGSRVEFLFTSRTGSDGKTYLDAKRSGIKVLEWAEKGSSAPEAPSQPSTAPSGAPKPASASPARTSGSSGGGPDWARKDAGAAASASVDKALAYFAITGFDNSFHTTRLREIADVARDMQKIVLELAEEILHPATPSLPEPKTSAPVKPAPKRAEAPRTKAKPEPAVNNKEPSWEEEEEGTFDSPFD
jgi:hypothetical protein